jgi:transposase
MIVVNVEKLREALNKEKNSEVRWKLCFISLVARGMKPEAAIAHFGIGIATCYT